jgi:hypothetical protein
MLVFRDILAIGKQVAKMAVDPGKTNGFLEDNLAVARQNAQHLLASLFNIQVMDEGNAEYDIHRGVR